MKPGDSYAPAVTLGAKRPRPGRSCSSVLMGEDVEGPRTFIPRNAKDVRFLDIWRGRLAVGHLVDRTGPWRRRARPGAPVDVGTAHNEVTRPVGQLEDVK